MTDAELHAAMRQLAERRWRGTVPTRLARELLPRIGELPDPERARLLAALTERTERGTR
jgi:hypothetical protein